MINLVVSNQNGGTSLIEEYNPSTKYSGAALVLYNNVLYGLWPGTIWHETEGGCLYPQDFVNIKTMEEAIDEGIWEPTTLSEYLGYIYQNKAPVIDPSDIPTPT